MLLHSIMKYSKDGSTLPVVLCKKYVTVHAYVSSNLIWTYTQICGKVMDSDNVKKEK